MSDEFPQVKLIKHLLGRKESDDDSFEKYELINEDSKNNQILNKVNIINKNINTMSLIQCPECGNKISDKADSCPQCGFILDEHQYYKEFEKSGKEKPTTIELTGKKLKLQKVLSVLCIIIGFIWVYLSINKNEHSEPSKLSFWVVAIGIVWYIITKIRIWWEHR
jgi:uncharacterized C2H2 Zn-finger protein